MGLDLELIHKRMARLTKGQHHDWLTTTALATDIADLIGEVRRLRERERRLMRMVDVLATR